MKNRRAKRILGTDRIQQPGCPEIMVINSGAEFSWYDEHGRVLKLRCGRVDAARVDGFFAIYINNVEVYSTSMEPGCGVSELTNLGIVNAWAETMFRDLFSQWEAKNQ
jgi:hypothetical protein